MRKKNLSFTQKLRENNEIITDTDNNENNLTYPLSSQEETITEYDGELPILIIPNTVFLPHTQLTIPLDKFNTDNLLKSINS